MSDSIQHTPGPWHKEFENGAYNIEAASPTEPGKTFVVAFGVSARDAELLLAAPSFAAQVAALKAQRDELVEALENLAAEFVEVFPIYYYAEPWAHDKNEKLKAARALIAKRKVAV